MKRWIALTLVAGASLLIITSPLRAIGGEEERGAVDAKGRCSAASIWRMTMEPEVGIKFEANIETGVPDQQWKVQLWYNKHVLLTTTEVTEDDGGFEVVIVENNARGDDEMTLTATNLDTGERCWGKLMTEL
jgi:hypothetical protein